MARSFPWTQCYVWEWQREDGGFSPYPADVIQLLEDHFHSARSGSKSSFFDLQLLPNSAKHRHPILQENIVDFAAMEQVHRESGELSLDLFRILHAKRETIEIKLPSTRAKMLAGHRAVALSLLPSPQGTDVM